MLDDASDRSYRTKYRPPFPWRSVVYRAIFLAAGIMAIVIGVECFLIDGANLYASETPAAPSMFDGGVVATTGTRSWVPGERFPWVLLAVGAVTVIYAFTLPQRFRRQAG